MRTSLWFWVIRASLLAVFVVGCKKTTTPDPVVVTPALTLVGNWKITAITFTPGWMEYTGATPIPDYIPYLAAKGQTCLTDLTVSFTAAGAYTTNSASLLSCGNVPESKVIIDYLFGSGRTFTETDTKATLYNADKTTVIPIDKSGTAQALSLQFNTDTDLSSHAIPTTYTVKLARQ